MILVLHGPNLNLLGEREPDIYGNTTLSAINDGLIEFGEQAGLKVECYQSNYEGQLIDWIHEHRNMAKGMIINPGGFTHTSVALADALAAYQSPIVEVHLSNIAGREAFRQHSYISPVATGVISGLGANGYNLALQHLITLLSEQS